MEKILAGEWFRALTSVMRCESVRVKLKVPHSHTLALSHLLPRLPQKIKKSGSSDPSSHPQLCGSREIQNGNLVIRSQDIVR